MTERKASMGDKVYRGDVIKFIRNNITLGTFMKRTVKTANEACWDLCDKLNYVPAIEEKPEPHTGHWEPVGMTEAVGGESAMWGSAIAYHKCSECGEQALEENGEEKLSDFCPHCGAKMEGTT